MDLGGQRAEKVRRAVRVLHTKDNCSGGLEPMAFTWRKGKKDPVGK